MERRSSAESYRNSGVVSRTIRNF